MASDGDTDDRSVEALFADATAAHAMRRIEPALEDYLRILDAEPGHVATLIHVAELYLSFDREDDARLVLEQLAKLDEPTLVQSVKGLASANLAFARFCASAGQGELADRILARALELWPDDPVPNAAVGSRLAEDGDYDDAEAYFRHAIGLAPERVATWMQLAELQAARGDIAGALEALLAVLEIDPGHSDAVRRAIAVIEDGLHDADLAAHFLHRLTELIEDDGEALAYIGFKMLADERFEGALTAFARASDLDLDTYETLIGTGTAAYGMGEEAAAEAYWTQGLAAIPDDVEAWLAVAQTFEHDLPRGMLVRLIEGAAARAGDDAAALCRVAETASELELHDAAAAALGRVLAIAPESAEARRLMEALARAREG